MLSLCDQILHAFGIIASAGTDEKSLLQKWLSSIIGTALPYTQTGDNEERALANTVTAGGLLLKHLTGEQLVMRIRV